MKMLRTVLAEAPLAWLLFAVPVAAVMHHLRPESALLVFVLACVAIVPLAGLLGARDGEAGCPLRRGPRRAPERDVRQRRRADHRDPGAAAGLRRLVKASITGSIIGNSLLVLGASLLYGGLKHDMPGLRRGGSAPPYDADDPGDLALPARPFPPPRRRLHHVAEEKSACGCSSCCSLSTAWACSSRGARTWRCIVGRGRGLMRSSTRLPRGAGASARRSSCWRRPPRRWLDERDPGRHGRTGGARLGMSEVFVGVIVVALIGNAAEHSTAVSWRRATAWTWR